MGNADTGKCDLLLILIRKVALPADGLQNPRFMGCFHALAPGTFQALRYIRAADRSDRPDRVARHIREAMRGGGWWTWPQRAAKRLA